MEQVEARYDAYFQGRISIHQLIATVPIKIADREDAQWHVGTYRQIVIKFWEHVVRQLQILETTTKPKLNDILIENDFLHMMIHYIRIKSEYGEERGQLFYGTGRSGQLF